jgi:4-carboxymuconolactone decarboxylase
MSTLSLRDRELVALGAALASNCVPCIEFHVPAARKAGLSDAEIAEAVAVADRIRQVPAGKVLDAAHAQLSAAPPAAPASACAPSAGGKSCC